MTLTENNPFALSLSKRSELTVRSLRQAWYKLLLHFYHFRHPWRSQGERKPKIDPFLLTPFALSLSKRSCSSVDVSKDPFDKLRANGKADCLLILADGLNTELGSS